MNSIKDKLPRESIDQMKIIQRFKIDFFQFELQKFLLCVWESFFFLILKNKIYSFDWMVKIKKDEQFFENVQLLIKK